MKWNTRADVAEHLQQGRVFLAGDSAHVMPPYGGFGGNTGVQDAHNLAWKLALVVKGEAGPALLDTYEKERRPVGAFTAEQAYMRYVTREAKYLITDDLPPLENDLNIELGYRYHSSAVIPDSDDDGRAHENPRESKGKPGFPRSASVAGAQLFHARSVWEELRAFDRCRRRGVASSRALASPRGPPDRTPGLLRRLRHQSARRRAGAPRRLRRLAGEIHGCRSGSHTSPHHGQDPARRVIDYSVVSQPYVKLAEPAP